jgi:serine/threonine protein phosphatase PrpC
VIESYGLSDVGQKRTNNEDSILVDAEHACFAVCDGLGGQNAGEVASRMAVETVQVFVAKSHQEKDITWPYGLTMDLSYDGNRLFTAIGLANKTVYRAADGKPEYTGMGTTVVSALVRENVLTVAWVGDSRGYYWRKGTLTRLTEDHTWVNMARKNGSLTEEEAAHHPWSHVLVKAVGGRDSVEPEVVEHRLAAGDIALLCSDGLTGMLTDDEIAGVLALAPTMEAAAKSLIAAANAAGGKDNVSVVLLRYTE